MTKWFQISNSDINFFGIIVIPIVLFFLSRTLDRNKNKNNKYMQELYIPYMQIINRLDYGKMEAFYNLNEEENFNVYNLLIKNDHLLEGKIKKYANDFIFMFKTRTPDKMNKLNQCGEKLYHEIKYKYLILKNKENPIFIRIPKRIALLYRYIRKKYIDKSKRGC